MSAPTTTRTGANSTHESALSYPNTVLLAADTSDEQHRYAGYYQEDALAMIAGA